MSENSSEMSERDSRMASASSALTACTAVKPASSTISTARIRNTISSSTTRTFVVVGVSDVIDPEDMAWAFFLVEMRWAGAACSGRYSTTDTVTLTRCFLSLCGHALLGTTTQLRVFPYLRSVRRERHRLSAADRTGKPGHNSARTPKSRRGPLRAGEDGLPWRGQAVWRLPHWRFPLWPGERRTAKTPPGCQPARPPRRPRSIELKEP